MSLVFQCTSCEKRFKVADTSAGKKVRCTQCGTVGTVPGPAAASVGALPPRPMAKGAAPLPPPPPRRAAPPPPPPPAAVAIEEDPFAAMAELEQSGAVNDDGAVAVAPPPPPPPPAGVRTSTSVSAPARPVRPVK